LGRGDVEVYGFPDEVDGMEENYAGNVMKEFIIA